MAHYTIDIFAHNIEIKRYSKPVFLNLLGFNLSLAVILICVSQPTYKPTNLSDY